MKKKLIVFGTGQIAQLAHFYFQTDSTYEVVGFTVDGVYIQQATFCDLPVVPFEDILSKFPPETYCIFIALSYSKLNLLRKEKFLASKALGYEIASYISSKALILNEHKIGDNCFVLENNIIQPFVVIGDNVTLWSGNHIGHHSTIGDHSFVASHAVISGGVSIGRQCFIGVNATIRDNVSVGDMCVIGAGTLLLGDAGPESVFFAPASELSRVPSTRLRKI